MYQLHKSISIREAYQLCWCVTTILNLSVTSKKWVSKQVLVSTYRYKTILGCDPQKMGTTIPNEEEIALKHSSLDSQLKTSAALSLSLWTYRSMRKVNETVDFTLTGADSQLSDIEYRGVEEFSFKQFQMSSARHMIGVVLGVNCWKFFPAKR